MPSESSAPRARTPNYSMEVPPPSPPPRPASTCNALELMADPTTREHCSASSLGASSVGMQSTYRLYRSREAACLRVLRSMWTQEQHGWETGELCGSGS